MGARCVIGVALRGRNVAVPHPLLQGVCAAGWSPREQARRLHPLDEDHSTIGARYLALAQGFPWLTLALERQGVGFEQSVYLGERLTVPGVTSLGERHDAPPVDLGLLRNADGTWEGGNQRVLRPYKCVAVAVLADLGAPAWLGTVKGADADDEHRRPSLLLFAGRGAGVSKPGKDDPKGARNARRDGRRLLAALGAWPWACRPAGELEPTWWAKDDVVAELVEWLDREARRDASARRARAAARRRQPL